MKRMRAENGQGLVELAIITPLFLILLIGLVEVSAALRNYIVIVQASREGARFATRYDVIRDDTVYQMILSAVHPLALSEDDTVIITRVRKRQVEHDYEIRSQSVYGPERESRLTPEWFLEQQKISTTLWEWEEEPAFKTVDFVVVEVFYAHSQVTGLFAFFSERITLYAMTAMRMGLVREGIY